MAIHRHLHAPSCLARASAYFFASVEVMLNQLLLCFYGVGAVESDLGGSLALRDRRAGLPRAPSARVELGRVDLADLGQMPCRSPHLTRGAFADLA